MNTIGRTNDGGYMVEMSGEEYRAFERLAQAVDGKTVDELKMNPSDHGFRASFAGTFGSIRAFTLAQYRVNELRQIINDFDSTLNRTD